MPPVDGDHGVHRSVTWMLDKAEFLNRDSHLVVVRDGASRDVCTHDSCRGEQGIGELLINSVSG